MLSLVVSLDQLLLSPEFFATSTLRLVKRSTAANVVFLLQLIGDSFPDTILIKRQSEVDDVALHNFLLFVSFNLYCVIFKHFR